MQWGWRAYKETAFDGVPELALGSITTRGSLSLHALMLSISPKSPSLQILPIAPNLAPKRCKYFFQPLFYYGNHDARVAVCSVVRQSARGGSPTPRSRPCRCCLVNDAVETRVSIPREFLSESLSLVMIERGSALARAMRASSINRETT